MNDIQKLNKIPGFWDNLDKYLDQKKIIRQSVQSLKLNKVKEQTEKQTYIKQLRSPFYAKTDQKRN